MPQGKFKGQPMKMYRIGICFGWTEKNESENSN